MDNKYRNGVDERMDKARASKLAFILDPIEPGHAVVIEAYRRRYGDAALPVEGGLVPLLRVYELGTAESIQVVAATVFQG